MIQNDCWALKNKIQDLIKAKEIEFDAPEMPNVIAAPMTKHNRGINSVDTDLFVSFVDEVSTPLLTFKKNLLLAGLFLGYGEGCHMCLSLPSGCYLLKAGVQRLMDNKEILFEKTQFPTVLHEDVDIITISANPSKVSSKRPVRITSAPRIAPLIITFPVPVPYSSDKVVPWNYGADVYYHGVKQDLKTKEVDPDISNIVGTIKITRSGRVFSPKISPKSG